MRRRHSGKRTSRKLVLLVAAAVIVSAVICGGLFRIFNRRVERTVTAAVQAEAMPEESVPRDRIVFEADPDVRSYLFLGVDDAGLDYGSFGHGGRTDTLLLLVKKGLELRVLEISRDTMTEVDTYTAAGDYLSTGLMQINMQYAYGDSPRRSAYLTKRTVSRLLGGIEINGAVALNMSGIAPIVDAMGGVDVRMEEDCTYIDAAYVEGTEAHLDGAAAERFIRWRDTSISGSNDARMSRHTWFIRQLLAQADRESVETLLEAAEPYLNTDLTAEEIQALYECELTETVRLPGETRRGELHDEFYVDEAALEGILLQWFYTPVGTK